jgi:hypothetical protein
VAKIQLVAGVLLAVYIAIVLAVLGFKAAAAVKLGKVEQQIKSESLAIGKLRQVEALSQVLKTKASLVRTFLDTRLSIREMFEQVVRLMPERVELEGFVVNEDNTTLTITFVSTDVYAAVELLNVLEQTIEDETYTSMVISDYSRSEDGSYSVTASTPI